MKKWLAAILGLVLFIVLIVVVLGGGDEEKQCVAGGSAGGAGLVNSDGLAYPTDPNATQVTSGFGMRWGALHAGVDLAGPLGTPIFAFADGTVVAAGPADGFGNWVVLDHQIDGEAHSTVYGHMAVIDVHVGDQVKAGDKIAEIGNEGGSTGPHLHFEYYNGLRLSGGTPIDPQPLVEKVRADGGHTQGTPGAGDDSQDAPAQPAAPSAPTGGEVTNEGKDVPISVPNDPHSLDERQLENIREIIAIGKGRSEPESFIKAAVMAGGPESGWRMLASRAVPESLNYPNDGVTPGDATSVGIFQIQTPMNMPVDQAMDRTKHIEWFYDTAKTNASPEAHPGDIAADVERPREDLRGKYREWEATADVLLESEGNIAPRSGSGCGPGSSGGSSADIPADATEFAEKAIAAAREQKGQAYVWGGGDWNGPTGGGFDCSGLTMYAYAQASGGTVKLDHYTTNQMNSDLLTERSPDDIHPGDLIFFNGASDPQHVGLAINSTTMIHAPDFGQTVTEAPIASGGELVAVRALKDVPKEDK